MFASLFIFVSALIIKIWILDSNKPILRSLQRAAGLLDNVEITAISEIDAAMEKLKKGELSPDFIYLGTFPEPDWYNYETNEALQIITQIRNASQMKLINLP